LQNELDETEPSTSDPEDLRTPRRTTRYKKRATEHQCGGGDNSSEPGRAYHSHNFPFFPPQNGHHVQLLLISDNNIFVNGNF